MDKKFDLLLEQTEKHFDKLGKNLEAKMSSMLKSMVTKKITSMKAELNASMLRMSNKAVQEANNELLKEIKKSFGMDSSSGAFGNSNKQFFTKLAGEIQSTFSKFL